MARSKSTSPVCSLMIEFGIGDIVKISDGSLVKSDLLHRKVNLYFIRSFPTKDTVTLGRWSMEDFTIDTSKLAPVKVDGEEDKSIYYDPVIAASTVAFGEPIPEYKVDYSYYLDSMANTILVHEKKTLRDLIIEKGFVHVHEIQHYLRVHNDDNSLKIKI